MSFTKELKEEILQKEQGKDCCNLAELAGIIAFSSTIKNGYLKITIENKFVARRIVKLLKRLLDIQAGIEVKAGGGVRKNDTFIISVREFAKLLNGISMINKEGSLCFPQKSAENPCCKKAFIKGAFLGGGSMSHPQKRYHLEFVTHYPEICEGFNLFLEDMEFAAKAVERKGKFVTYFKDCDSICNLLAIAGASLGVMKIYQEKVYKDKKNEINRLNNSEVANIMKTVTASTDQRACIEKIQRTAGLESLPESLKKLAEVRLKYPDDGLAQLGARLNPPIGKSGVNHRMRKIIEISKRY